METEINDYWKPQWHALLIFYLYLTILVQDWRGHFDTEMLPRWSHVSSFGVISEN